LAKIILYIFKKPGQQRSNTSSVSNSVTTTFLHFELKQSSVPETEKNKLSTVKREE